jgi:hypothetical protein
MMKRFLNIPQNVLTMHDTRQLLNNAWYFESGKECMKNCQLVTHLEDSGIITNFVA